MNPTQPTNDLLARYLQAIGNHLPAASREDVLAELRANLQAQIDDRAEELNRPLTDPEVAAILRDHGRPIVVAARYLPQQYLIGPAIFPYYLMTLRKAAPFVAVICFLAEFSHLLAVHTLPELIASIFVSLGQLIPDLILFAFWVTLAFAIAEFVYTRNHAQPFGLPWDPTKLPTLKPQFKGKSRAGRIVDLVFHCLFILYILAIPGHPFLLFGPGIYAFQTWNVAFAPAWHTYYLLLLALLGIQLIPKILALSPGSERYQPIFNLVLKLAGLASTVFLASMKTYIIATGPAANQANLAVVNHWIGVSFRIVLLIVVLQLLIDAWKLVRPTLRTKSLAF